MPTPLKCLINGILVWVGCAIVLIATMWGLPWVFPSAPQGIFIALGIMLVVLFVFTYQYYANLIYSRPKENPRTAEIKLNGRIS